MFNKKNNYTTLLNQSSLLIKKKCYYSTKKNEIETINGYNNSVLIEILLLSYKTDSPYTKLLKSKNYNNCYIIIYSILKDKKNKKYIKKMMNCTKLTFNNDLEIFIKFLTYIILQTIHDTVNFQEWEREEDYNPSSKQIFLQKFVENITSINNRMKIYTNNKKIKKEERYNVFNSDETIVKKKIFNKKTGEMKELEIEKDFNTTWRKFANDLIGILHAYEGIYIEERYRKMGSKKGKSTIKWNEINNIFDINLKLMSELNFQFTKPEFSDCRSYIIGYHWKECYSIYKINWRTLKRIKLNRSDINRIYELCTTPVFIDLKDMRQNLTIIAKNIKGDRYNKYISMTNDYEIDWNKFIRYLNIEKEEISIKYNKNYNKYILKSLNEELLSIKITIDYYKLYTCVIESGINFYYPIISIDFRGRIYFKNGFTITNSKEFRFTLQYFNFTKHKKHLNKIDKKILKKREIVRLITTNFNVKENMEIIQIFWLLLSLGNTIKDKTKSNVSLTELINLGLEKFSSLLTKQDYVRNADIEDILQQKMIYKILFYIKMGDKNIPNYMISKDATASVLQLMSILIPSKNIDFKVFNLLEEDVWYDPYWYYCNKLTNNFWDKDLKKYWKLDDEDWVKLVNRKMLKKIIMTINYGATDRSLKKYYEDLISYETEMYFINKYNKSDIINIVIKKLIYELNNDLNLFDRRLFWMNETNNEEDFKKLSEVKLYDGVVISSLYYRIKKKQVAICVNGSKIRSRNSIITDKIDTIKTRTAYPVNYIHANDALILRYIYKYMNVLTIHDCVLTPYKDCSILIYRAQKIFKKISKYNNDKDFNSLFIFL